MTIGRCGQCSDNGDRRGSVSPRADWHTYRVEVRSHKLTVSIDGAFALSTTDNPYLIGAKVGLWSNGVQIRVRRVEVTAPDWVDGRRHPHVGPCGERLVNDNACP